MSDSEGSAFLDEIGVTYEDEVLFTAEDQDIPSCSAQGTIKKKGGGIKPLVSCHLCGKPFKSIETYVNHAKTHLLQDLFSTAPGYHSILLNCRKYSKEILNQLHSGRITGGFSGEVKQLVGDLLSLPEDRLWQFVDFTSENINQCLPDFPVTLLETFNATFTKSNAVLLNNAEKRSALLTTLKEIITFDCGEETLQWFLTKFILDLAASTEAFFLQCLKAPLTLLNENTSRGERDDPEDLDFQRSVYYIGGSAVKSVIRLGCSAKKSDKWKRIVECCKSRLLVEELVHQELKDIVAWTEGTNRGGLLFISEDVWSFLMALSGVLKGIETPDGSVHHDMVITRVKEDDILMLMWREIVDNNLSEEDSLFLLVKLCFFFVNAWGKGIANRHLNAIQGQTKGKVALRPSLAR